MEKDFVFINTTKIVEMYYNEYSSKEISFIIMLATSVSYDGRIMKTQRTSMNKKEIKKYIGISNEDRFNKFIKKLEKDKIIILVNGEYLLSQSICLKGRVIETNQKYIPIYCEVYKEKYNRCTQNELKRFGYVGIILNLLEYSSNAIRIKTTDISAFLNINKTTWHRCLCFLEENKLIEIIDGFYTMSEIKITNKNEFNYRKLDEWIYKSKKSRKFDSYKLYKIRCYNEDENFYKIGITYRELEYRFGSIPYDCEIISIISSDDPEFIWKTENELHSIHKKLGFSYRPKIKFSGIGECYTKLI